MEGLEPRQLLAANLASTGGVHPDAIIDQNENIIPANIGLVAAASAAETEAAGTVGENDTIASAEFVPLGTRASDEPLVDISGTLSLFNNSGGLNQAAEDVDFYAVDLRAGDILDLAGNGAAGAIDVFYENGRRWIASDAIIGDPTLFPESSPLQTIGNVAVSQVVPETGRYFIRVGTNGLAGSYTIGARTYRPVLEQEPIGTQQILFIDFDGFTAPRSLIEPIDPATGLPNTGTIRIDPLQEGLASLNLVVQNEDELIDSILEEVHRHFASTVTTLGGNGDFANTGTPGEYGIQILNSRDHADPVGQEHVTRAVVGGSNADIFFPGGLLGISESVDIGNFDTSEVAFVVLDVFLPLVTGIPTTGAISQLDLISKAIARTTSHEAAHSFGLLHTDGANDIINIIDSGPTTPPEDRVGAGPDGIVGTSDDEAIVFPFEDRFDLAEGFFGFQRVAGTLAHVLSTGTVGQSISGRVFNDLNGNGSGSGDPGLGGVTLFADLDNDGNRDPSEPNAVTQADGTYQLDVPGGTTTVVVVPPPNTAPTTPTSQTTSVPVSGIDFGFTQLLAQTGTKFEDLNGNGTQEANEPGIEGVYIYIDLDGDDRIDVGEPRAITAADGSYTIEFPGPGTYTLREVLEPGFIQTSPASGEWTVNFDGGPLDRNFDFANLPARDWGDAPAAYPVTAASNGASHGITPGLTLGLNVDREPDGQPSADAQGDDDNGAVDDEDGIRVLSPIAPGSTATIEVVARNDGSTAFLSGWVDLDRDNVWEASEQLLVDRPIGGSANPQTLTYEIAVPASATPGDVVARFRLSRESGLGPTGRTDSGEVEDHIFTVQPSANLVNDDTYTVSRNTVGNVLDVLSNDFQTPTNPLTVDQLNLAGTRGSVQISGNGQTVLYTPPSGFTGRDVFSYVALPVSGGADIPVEDRTATVVVNVSFSSEDPIAVDDTFEIPQGSTNRPLNVLDNDIPSINGGSTIVSVGGATAGGTVQIAGGGQSLRYSPAIGFNGTEQFSYTILDSAGRSDTAQVTVNMSPGSRQDDQVAFNIGTFDADDNRPLDNIQVGDDFLLRVSVDDLRPFSTSREGVVSAFLDLLYSQDLVSLIPRTGGDFPFEITFGPLFAGAGGDAGFQQGDADTPGLLNEIGGLQRPGQEQEHSGPVTLFTIRMQAIAPGFATFQADPADRTVSEVLVLDQDTVVPVSGLRLGSHELRIEPRVGDGNFTTAVDDSFPDGIDSNGNAILAGGTAQLDVLENDIINPDAELQEFGVGVQPRFGSVEINNAGTTDPSDDFFMYQANVGQQGVERFSYFITDTNGIRSTAEVSFNVGDAASDDQAAIEFRIVDEAGNPIDEISAGQRFGVQVIIDDLRSGTADLGIFAAFLDVLYDADLVTPSDNFASNLGFDVAFESGFNAELAVGNAQTPGIINEFGAFRTTPGGEADPTGGAPELMATIFFVANPQAAGQTVRFVGDKADFSPFQDTLFFEPPEPVDPDRIRYDIASVEITGPAEGESLLQNQSNPLDVNNDGFVSPIDALSVINALNTGGTGEGETARVVTRFVDVDGNGKVEPFDALRVINALNKQATQNAAEGEWTPVPLIPVDPPFKTASPEDAVYADFENGTLEASAPVASKDVQAQNLSTGVVSPEVNAEDDEDEDDVLALLADDVHHVWK